MGRPTFRLRAGLLLMVFVFSLFAGRLVQIQGIDAHAYSELSDKYEGATEVTLTASRGAVVDRDGAPLAQTVDAELLFADPTRTSAKAPQIAKIIADRIDVSYLTLVKALRKPGTQYSYLARRVMPKDADAIMAELEAKDLAGVYTERDPLRTYPAGDIASNLVGFVGSDGHGLAGIELAMEQMLKGKDGHATYVTDAQGTRIPLADSSVVEPKPGKGVALTIDEDLQFYAQRRLRQAVDDTGSISGAVVVMDPRTSQVLALADYPSFDANKPGKAPKADRGSRAVQDVYEPGSVQKVLTTAALIDAGKVTSRTKVSVPGLLRRGPDTIKDWWPHETLHMTLAGVIARSSNIGTAVAAEQIEPEDLYDYLRAFGLGQRTDLGLAGETKGLLPPPESWQPISRDTIAFGQGLSVNAVQMTAAVSAIANGGEYVRPSLVKGYVGAGGEVEPAGPAKSRRVVSKNAADQVTEMMEMVTADNGTAPSAAIDGYRVAGKTGTAQRVNPDGGGYEGGGYTLSFAGFAPADDPRVVTYIVLQKPSTSDGGGTAGGPVFHDITSYALQKYGVPPTGSRSPELPLGY
ncbi:MAG: penicillin-binding protein 2 [Propionibacteriales bacterium]|nr:penicillin-binding protein 2 [Propionibacteriales bacterium]